MPIQPTESPHLASVHALGLALASDPRDVLVGFLRPSTRMGRPVWMHGQQFPGAILYALTRSGGSITQVTYQLHPGNGQEGQALLRSDGDWQLPSFPLGRGATTITVTAHTADGQQAQSHLTVVSPDSDED